jgi:hypothetical protein
VTRFRFVSGIVRRIISGLGVSSFDNAIDIVVFVSTVLLAIFLLFDLITLWKQVDNWNDANTTYHRKGGLLDRISDPEFQDKARKAATQLAVDHAVRTGQKIGSNCFITTAVCGSFGKPDDCRELTAFRAFRDNWLIKQPDGKALVDEYYHIAPRIVAAIDAVPDSGRVYRGIWDAWLADCLRLIDSGRFAECRDVYVRMVRELGEEWV